MRRWRKECRKTLGDVEVKTRGRIKMSYLSQVENGRLPSPRIETILSLALYHYGIAPARFWKELGDVLIPGQSDEEPSMDWRVWALERRMEDLQRQVNRLDPWTAPDG